ncbi:PssD/Cps14F family polysaccharide biosynthesis glycosyltransferase [Maribacter litoralis]|uniref:PssD/Cps14F family polysaccharide biosynthesis glycosyltransferase n=1 Tax=Maribacter litoralis TaxID=2059726 RepID=UPI003F5CE372
MKKVLFMSSLGGHLEQLLALEPTMDMYDSCIVTENNPSTLKLKDKYKEIYYLPYISRSSFLSFVFSFVSIFLKSLRLFVKLNPNVIISTGSGCVLPMFILGRIFGKKLIFIETFSRIESKTLTGSFCYYLADVFIVQWKELKKLYPKAIYLGSIY